MKLTEEEHEYLNKLIKRENQFYSLRYVNMILAVLCILVAFGAFILFIYFKDGILFQEYASHPMFYLLCIGGGIAIGNSIRGWKGDPTSKLLIKVIQDLNEKQ